jgi:hypothetical protein
LKSPRNLPIYLLMAQPAFTVNVSLYKNSCDPLRDFAPVTLVATGANVLVIHPSVPHMPEGFHRAGKAKPGQQLRIVGQRHHAAPLR